MENLVGDTITAQNAFWTFSGDIPKAFDEHVTRSVPFYQEGHDLIAKVSDYFLPDGARCYELGCSTGTLLQTLAEKNALKRISFIGIDCEKGMIDEAIKKCYAHKNIILRNENVLDLEMEKCDLVISYYTMQFIHPKNRQEVFNRIYKALNWGGAFILFEKVRANDARFQDIMSGIYTDYKLEQGYKAEEIIAKARSLKGVLEPFSTQGNLDLLKRAGFADCLSVMKYVCFEGILAIK